MPANNEIENHWQPWGGPVESDLPENPTLVECEACGEMLVARHASTDSATRGFCVYCARNFFRCACCNGVRSNRDRGAGALCIRCQRRTRFSFEPIGTPPFLGVEVEVESTEEDFTKAQRETLAILPEGFATLKEDGSLSENGFEIVSRPASYVEQVAAWTPFFEGVREGKLGRLTAWSNDTCGLHVHICRNAIAQANPFGGDVWQLSEHTIALLVCFVNLPRNRRFIQTIAGRDANHYTTFQRKRMQDAARRTGQKYEAVNLEHSNTLEFRIFKGTLKAQSFFKALEFVLSLSEFCKGVYNVRKALALSAYIRFVRENSSRFPNLDSFISNRWYGKRDRNGAAVWRLINNRKPPLPPIDHSSRGSEQTN